MSQDLQPLIRRYYDALNHRALDALDGLVACDLVHHGLPGVSSRSSLKEVIAAYHEAFPDLLHAIEDVIAEGDRIVVRTTTTGSHLGDFLGHSPSGRSFRAAALSVYRVRDGLIHEVWEVFDTFTMLQQLGLSSSTLPPRPRVASARRPPGPAGEVPLGQIRSDPLGFLTQLTRDHGDYARYVCDGREIVLLNHPNAIRHILHDSVENYTKLDTPDLLLLKPMLGDGLLTTVGPVWKRDRQRLQPVFARLTEHAAPSMVAVIEKMLLRWLMCSEREVPLDIAEEMSRLTLEIAARIFLSADFASHSEAFGKAMNVLNESMSHSSPADPEVEQQFRTALAFIRRTVWQAVLARKFYDSGERDVLAAILDAQREGNESDQYVIDQAITILLAGHETTAKALTWSVVLLNQHPQALATLLVELDDCLGRRPPVAADLANLRYTRAVIDEALRLYPPIWLLTRTALKDDQVAGYTIPAGALVAVSPYLIHRHPDFWPDPERFIPDRFLAGDRAMQAYRYLPFGHGPRYCIGKFFASLEMPLVLAMVFSQFELSSVSRSAPQPEALVTLRPRNGLPMIATARPRHVNTVLDDRQL